MTVNRLKNISEYYFSKKLREIEELNASGKQVINLGIGSPDLAPHASVITALHEAAAEPQNHAYQSYKGNIRLRKAAADWYQQHYNVSLNADTEILPLLGSKEGIMHICMSVLNEGDLALIPNPGYPTYSAAANIAGAQIQNFDLSESHGWLPDIEKLSATVAEWRSLAGNQHRTIVMFINYPNMPTGKTASIEELKTIVAFCRTHNVLLIHDNPYSFILNKKPLSILAVEGALDVCIELNSLSKSHNMAGWRVGFVFGNAERINEVLRFKSNMDSGMFLPVQFAAAAALGLGADWFDGLNEIYAERKVAALQLLDLLGCTYSTDQSGMFVWAKVPKGFKDAYAFTDSILINAAVFITPGGIFGSNGNGYVRVSLCSPVSTFEQATKRIAEKLASIHANEIQN